MLRTQHTLNRLVRLCLKGGSSCVTVPRLSTLPEEHRLITPAAVRWFSCTKPHFSIEPSAEGSDDDAVAAKERKLKILQMEVSVLRQEGRRVPDPDRVKPDQWEQLLGLASKSARSKYYAFLWTIEMKRESEKVLILNIFLEWIDNEESSFSVEKREET